MGDYFQIISSMLSSALCFIAPIALIVFFKISSMKKQYAKSNYKSFSNCKNVMKLIKDTGAYGEYLVFKELEKKYQENLILANVYIPNKEGKTTEIDLIMIHKTGIYVFESKNYSGWVFGQENNKKWTITLNKKTKNQILNPIIQNKIHVKALMNYLGLDESYFNSVIVFSDRCEFRKLETTTPVIKRGNLLKTLNTIMENKNEIINESQIKDIYDKLYQCCNMSEEVKLKHINDIKESIGG